MASGATDLRSELPLAETTVVVRGGRDTVNKLRGHAERPARAWSLAGIPLLGISVFAVLDEASAKSGYAFTTASSRVLAGQWRSRAVVLRWE